MSKIYRYLSRIQIASGRDTMRRETRNWKENSLRSLCLHLACSFLSRGTFLVERFFGSKLSTYNERVLVLVFLFFTPHIAWLSEQDVAGQHQKQRGESKKRRPKRKVQTVREASVNAQRNEISNMSVSYTHLTLPTNREV